jgi:hypothetical protein
MTSLSPQYIAKIALKLVSVWHSMVWMPFTAKLLKYPWGQPIIRLIHLFFGTLVILRIIAPGQNELPCLIHLFIRRRNKWLSISIKRRIYRVIQFWKGI